MDKILTEKDIEIAFSDCPLLDPSFVDDYKAEVKILLETQDAKTNKRWLDWGDEPCSNSATTKILKRECSKCWKARKEEIA